MSQAEVTEVRAERLRPGQLRARREAHDLAYLPLGTLEWHGVQNPIGVDAIKAHAVCAEAARIGGGVTFPALLWAVPRDSFHMDTNGPKLTDAVAKAYGVPAEVVQPGRRHGGMDPQEQWLAFQRMVRMALEQIAGFGFRSIYIVTGHQPLVHWVHPVGVAFTRATADAGWAVTTDWCGEFEPAGLSGDHAGRWETSLTMAAAAETVDFGELERQPDYLGVGAGRDAVDASAEQGRQWLTACAIAIAAEAAWLVENYPKCSGRHRHAR